MALFKSYGGNDDNIRIQLENGYNHWDFEGGMEQWKKTTPEEAYCKGVL